MGGSCEDFWNMWIIEDVGTDLFKKTKTKKKPSLRFVSTHWLFISAMGRAQRKGRGEILFKRCRLTSPQQQNEIIKKISQNTSGILSLHLVIILICISYIKAQFYSSVAFWRGEGCMCADPLCFFFFFPSLFSRLTYSLSSTVLSLVAEAGVWQHCLSGVTVRFITNTRCAL